MASPSLSIKPIRKRRSAAGGANPFSDMETFGPSRQQISAAAIARDKGFQLADIGDLAKDAGPFILDKVILDPLMMPQRELFSVLGGDGFVDPFSKEAEKYTPSKHFNIKGNGLDAKLTRAVADIALDPMWLAGGPAKAISVPLKAGAKTALGFRAAKQAIDEGAAAEAANLDKMTSEIKGLSDTLDSRAPELAAAKEKQVADLNALQEFDQRKGAWAANQKTQRYQINRQGVGATSRADAVPTEPIVVDSAGTAYPRIPITPKRVTAEDISATERQLIDSGIDLTDNKALERIKQETYADAAVARGTEKSSQRAARSEIAGGEGTNAAEGRNQIDQATGVLKEGIDKQRAGRIASEADSDRVVVKSPKQQLTTDPNSGAAQVVEDPHFSWQVGKPERDAAEKAAADGSPYTREGYDKVSEDAAKAADERRAADIAYNKAVSTGSAVDRQLQDIVARGKELGSKQYELGQQTEKTGRQAKRATEEADKKLYGEAMSAQRSAEYNRAKAVTRARNAKSSLDDLERSKNANPEQLANARDEYFQSIDHLETTHADVINAREITDTFRRYYDDLTDEATSAKSAGNSGRVAGKEAGAAPTLPGLSKDATDLIASRGKPSPKSADKLIDQQAESLIAERQLALAGRDAKDAVRLRFAEIKSAGARRDAARAAEADARKAADEYGKYLAAHNAGPYVPVRGGSKLVEEMKPVYAQGASSADSAKAAFSASGKEIKTSTEAAAQNADQGEQALRQMAAIDAISNGETRLVPKIKGERFDTKKAMNTEAKLKRNLADSTANVSKAEEMAAAADNMSPRMKAAQVDAASDLAKQSLAADQMGFGLALQWFGIELPYFVTPNANMVKLAQAMGTIPLLGPVGSVLNKSFNSSAGIDKQLYQAKLILARTGTALTEREQGLLNQAKQLIPATERKDITAIAVQATDNSLIDASKPDTWLSQAEEFEQLANAWKTSLEFIPPNAADAQAAKIQSRVDAYLETAKSLRDMNARWERVSDKAREGYFPVREYYGNALEQSQGFGLLTKADERPNYIYTKKLSDEERYAGKRQATAPTNEAAFMHQRKDFRIPDDYDLWEWASVHSRDLNKVVVDREFTRLMAYKWGKTASEKKDLPGRWVELPNSKDLLGTKIYVSEEVAKGIERSVAIGVDPVGQSAIGRFVNDLSGKWKGLAYSVNFGRFTTDTIGDTYNTILEHGPGIMPHMSTALDRGGMFAASETFLRELDKGKNYDDVIEFNGKKIKLGDLAKQEIEVGMSKKAKYRVDRFAFQLLETGSRNTGYAAGDMGRSVGSMKGALGNTVDVGGRDVPAPKPFSGFGSFMQGLGNRRDNWSRRLASTAAVSLFLAKGEAPHVALIKARQATRRSLFDYSELTAFEKRFARNFVPFYTWTRKNVPFQLRKLGERPVQAIAPFKVQNAFEDPSQADYNIPDYLRARYLNLGQLPGPLGKLLGQKKGQPFFLNPMLPGFDLGFAQKQTGGLDLTQPLGMINPLLRVPMELAMKKPTNMQTGAEINGKLVENNGGMPVLGGVGEYLVQNLLGQPGREVVAGLDSSKPKADRLLPVIGSQTGIRGKIIDPVEQQAIAEQQIKEKQKEQIQLLQDAGLLPSYDQIEAYRQAQKNAGFAKLEPFKKRKRNPFASL